MAKVLVAGLATVDFLFAVDELPKKAEKYRANDAGVIGGGGAANAAVSVVRLGGESRLLARIGDDRIGDMILADLDAERVDTSLVHRTREGQSPFSSVLIDASGERQIVNFRGSGLQDMPSLEAAPPFDAVLADTRFSDLTRYALVLAKERGIPGVVDAEHPVDLACLASASHIAFSAQGLRGLTGNDDLTEALISVAAQVSAWVCVTDGARGVLYIRSGKVEHFPTVPVEAVDTLAAGDVWHGAFTLRLAEGANEEAAMEFANAAATLKCKGFGGRTSCPNRSDTIAFMKRNARPHP